MRKKKNELRSWLEGLNPTLIDGLTVLYESIEGQAFCNEINKPKLDWSAIEKIALTFQCRCDQRKVAHALMVISEHLINRLGDEFDIESIKIILPVNYFLIAINDQRLASGLNIIESLRITIKRTNKWNRFIFNEYLTPAIKDMINKNNIAIANYLSNLGYQWTQTDPTKNTHMDYINAIEPIYRNFFGATERKIKTTSKSKKLAVAFITDHIMHKEAPDWAFFSIAKGNNELPEKDKISILLVPLAGISNNLRRRLSLEGVDVISDEMIKASNQYNHLINELIVRNDIDTTVYFGTTASTCYTRSKFITSTPQIYCSVAYDYLPCGNICGRMLGTSNNPFVVKNTDGLWRFGKSHFFIQKATEPQMAEAIEIRNGFRKSEDTVIIGAIARATKLSDEFIFAVSEILKSRSQAIFLWTDFLHDNRVQGLIDKLGISSRCFFVGYVDYIMYTHVLDIHLDPFPFSSGLTMRQTWSEGKAHVCMYSQYVDSNGATVDNPLGLVAVSVEPILKEVSESASQSAIAKIFGSSLEKLPAARSVHQYIELAKSLIDSSDLRNEIGLAAKAYSREFLENYVEGALDHIQGFKYFTELALPNSPSTADC